MTQSPPDASSLLAGVLGGSEPHGTPAQPIDEDTEVANGS